jgi:hypothetical protein
MPDPKKTRIIKPTPTHRTELDADLQHAVVRGDAAECDRIRAEIASLGDHKD